MNGAEHKCLLAVSIVSIVIISGQIHFDRTFVTTIDSCMKISFKPVFLMPSGP